MVKILNSHERLSKVEMERFEKENNLQLPKQYKMFLLKWNGGYPEPYFFWISKEQGPSVLNVFFGMGEMDNNLKENIDLLDDRLPSGFIPIGDDPAGNIICLGTKDPFYEKIYFWDHEQETENPDEMVNMYFLANDIFEFLNVLYEDPED